MAKVLVKSDSERIGA
jgi:hypothetical protein